MKLTINTDERYSETEIILNCTRINDDIEKLLSAIRVFDMKLTGRKDGHHHFIDVSKIIYIESNEKRTFFYTSADVYECFNRLYELEEMLAGQNFIRASKTSIFNLNYVRSLKSDLEQKLILTMENDLKIVVSRQFSSAVKKKLEAIHGQK